MYLDYERYVDLGGKVPLSNYPFYEKLARKKLDYWTMDRVPRFLEEYKEDIELSMFLIIRQIHQNETEGNDVSSVSNDGISMSFVGAKTADEKMQDVYQKVVEILPIELISLVVD